jgi:hypothetical protein
MRNASIAAQANRGSGWAASQKAWIWRATSMAKNKTKAKTAIYHPPKKGMPYLVVTVSSEGVTVTAVGSKEEARILASKKTLDVEFEDARTDKS